MSEAVTESACTNAALYRDAAATKVGRAHQGRGQPAPEAARFRAGWRLLGLPVRALPLMNKEEVNTCVENHGRQAARRSDELSIT